MKWIALFTCIILANPVWFVGDRWIYDVKVDIKKENADGTVIMKNFVMEVVGENELSYIVETKGNISGDLVIHKFIDILVKIIGIANATFFFNKENLAVINGSVYMKGFMIFMERKLEFYLILNISFNPPYKIFDFPLEKNKKWVSETNASIEGELYIEKFVSPPRKIETYNSTVKEFECLGIEEINVKAGKYSAWHIISKNIDVWYVDNVKNIVKLILKEIKLQDTTVNIEMELNNYKIKEINPPEVEIIRPKEGYLYIFDREIIEMKNTIVIGEITVIAEANGSNLKKMEFYFDNELCFIDEEMPYEWKCNENAIGKKEIKCIVYDSYGNKAEDEIEIIYVKL